MGKSACDAKIRAEGRCRLCLRAWTVRQPTRHRIVMGRDGGRYEAVNVVGLCRPCHSEVDHWDRSRRAIARRMLRASMWPVEVAHGIARMGHRNFDADYPRPTRELIRNRRVQARLDAAMHPSG